MFYMQNADWEKVKELLDEVLRIEPSERQTFLRESAASDEVKAEVESLIAFESEAENLMSLSAIEFSKDFFGEQESNALLGQQIGVYRIVREIGYGGMGAVYLAERNDGKFEQKVALKLLKRELNVKRLRHSFKRESEIQSKLNHPNVARLLDAGTIADGIPYLALEYIEGLPLDEFCERNNLPLKERLKIFIKACQAVSFAHQNLIIHRDLKPSNILVTPNGELKLLDFGISKILDEEQIEGSDTLTMLGAMTPDYASPEQIKGETVTTATDIYSLGVVLYKILTGTLPYDLSGKTKVNLLKTIGETEPSTPSLQNTNPGSAVRNPQLKGDLDNIILKAIRKEPARRYKSVEQFSADIWRFIDGLPVLARPSTISYRANKFFQRNKIPVIAGVLIFVSLVAGIAISLRETRLAVQSQKLAVAEAEKAKEEQRKSEKVTRFMTKIIGYANPIWYAEGAKFGKDARVIDAIIDLSDKIDTEFAAEPDVAAELHHHFAFVILPNSGSLRPEEKKRIVLLHARRAFELRKLFYGEKHELVAKDMVYLYWAGGIAENERASYLMAAMNMMRETNPHNLNLPYMLEDYTSRLILPEYEKFHDQYRNAVLPPTNQSKYEIAEEMLRESLPVFRHHYKTDNSAIYHTECKLSYTLAMQEKWTDFDEHFALCKQGIEKYWRTNEAQEKPLKTAYKLIEEILAEKNKLPQ